MRHLIQWPKAKYWTKQWNPVIGCRPCSPACENCYAAAWAKRFGQSFEPHTTKQKPPRKGVVFCGNMTDLFGEWVDETENPYHFIPVSCYNDQTAVLWLTKRAGKMAECLARGDKDFDYKDPLSNHYFGFTAENQEWYDKRFREARKIPGWANWWISCEPLLGPINLDLTDRHPITGSRGVIPHLPSWVVVGCESGPKRRPCKIEWVESIAQQCADADVPVFVKQLDIGGKCVTDINQFPEHLRIRQVPWAEEIYKAMAEDQNK